MQELETEFDNDGTENNSQILTHLANMANDINGIRFCDTSATKLYGFGKAPLPLVKKIGRTAKVLFAEGIQLFNRSKDTQSLFGRQFNFKILDVGYTFIKTAIANTNLITEEVTLQIFELACIFGKSSLDVGEHEKANQAFNEAKACEIDKSKLRSEITPRYHELQFVLHVYLAEMYLIKNDCQACSLMVDIATLHINEATPAKQVKDLCATCLRATIHCLYRNNIEEAFIWSKVNFFKVEDKALACGRVLAFSLRIMNAKLQAGILLNDEIPEATASSNTASFLAWISNVSHSDILLHFMILKLKIKYFGTNIASLCEAYQDAMSQSRLTDRNVNILVAIVDLVKTDVGPEQLIQGLDQLIVKNTMHIGQSLRKVNFETIHIIKFHIIGTWCEDDPKTAKSMIELACEGLQNIKNDLEIVTIYGICMVKAYRTAAFCFDRVETFYGSDALGDTNLMMMRREAVDIILMIQVLLANNEHNEASDYLLCLPKSKGYNISMSNFITDVQK
ncbi:hypothetical protein BC943DRAFT_356255 [Umbelopsis sp. AD052]|nr:hypothetical protein BC943DRAFT_356255 [Umbelopsis sp. AD052]